MQEESTFESTGLYYGNQAETQCDGGLSHQIPQGTDTRNAFVHRLGFSHTSLRALPFLAL